eukprot:1774325-Rhodomonas_salina.1
MHSVVLERKASSRLRVRPRPARRQYLKMPIALSLVVYTLCTGYAAGVCIALYDYLDCLRRQIVVLVVVPGCTVTRTHHVPVTVRSHPSEPARDSETPAGGVTQRLPVAQAQACPCPGVFRVKARVLGY